MEDFNHNLDKITLYLGEEIKNVQNHKDFNTSKNNFYLLNEKGKYLFETIDLYVKLNKLLDDINMVEVFITTYPAETYKENKINEIKFINYHLEVFYHKIHTICEVFKLMVNTAFELGLKPENCKWKQIEKKKDFIDQDLLNLIERYDTSFKTFINVRHFNSHRSFNVNQSSNYLSTLLFLQENFSKGKLQVSNEMLNQDLLKHKNEKIEHIKNSTFIAKKYVDEFIDKILLVVVTRGDSK